MEFAVMMHDEQVGTCTLEDLGLYWRICCKCKVISQYVERLYAGTHRLGVLEKEGEWLTLNRRLSKASTPELPPKSGILTLHPVQEQEQKEETLWEGEILGEHLKGILRDDALLFPYRENEPCPCEPLLCLFEIRDGYWRLPIKDR